MTTPVYDVILRQGRLLRPSGQSETVDIAIQDGKIAAIAPQRWAIDATVSTPPLSLA